jgi:hypothetical protein
MAPMKATRPMGALCVVSWVCGGRESARVHDNLVGRHPFGEGFRADLAGAVERAQGELAL